MLGVMEHLVELIKKEHLDRGMPLHDYNDGTICFLIFNS